MEINIVTHEMIGFEKANDKYEAKENPNKRCLRDIKNV